MVEKIHATKKPLEPTVFNILIVDDCIENLQMLEETLCKEGFIPFLAWNAQDALNILREEDIHLIIADAYMQETDGFQLCRMVKSKPRYKNIMYFISTGDYVDIQDEYYGYKIGVDGYFYKTEGYEQLLDTINDAVFKRYGVDNNTPEIRQNKPDNAGSRENHHRLIVKKLEEKITQLEKYAGKLRNTNRKIRTSEARFRSLFENASVPIVILDCKTGTIIDANNQAELLFENTKEELKDLRELPFVETNNEVKKVFWTEKYISGETAIQTKNGKNIDVHITGVHIKEPEDSRIILYLRDISENRKFKQKLREIEKMALIGRLAAGIAHDIRNPLTGVTVNLQYVQQNYPAKDDVREAIDLATEGAHRIEEVIEKTLSLARTKPPSFAPENMNEIIKRTLEFMKIPFRQKRVTVSKKLSDKLPSIFVDDKEVQQVLLNIFHNALDAVPKEGTIAVATELESNRNGDAQSGAVIVKITDNGVGITQKELDHIFEPFRTTKSGGTGLGLALSKYIMDRHNAALSIDSLEGEGTTVTLRFPVQ